MEWAAGPGHQTRHTCFFEPDKQSRQERGQTPFQDDVKYLNIAASLTTVCRALPQRCAAPGPPLIPSPYDAAIDAAIADAKPPYPLNSIPRVNRYP